ncbi:hypothetical protein ACFQ1N_17560 [Paracoccus fistulariae]
MLRFLCLTFTLLFAQIGFAQGADLTARLWQVMDIEELLPIMRDEAVSEADDIRDMLFPRGGTGSWTRDVQAIHRPERLARLFRGGLDAALPGMDRARIDQGLSFYDSDLGQRLLDLESAARIAMLDEEAEDAAKLAYSRAEQAGSERADQIARLIEAADLIGHNVAGGMNVSIAFSQGFGDAGGFDMTMGEADILGDVWAQQGQIASDVEDWLQGYMMLAYSSLSDQDLEAYIDFVASPPGQALFGALFAGFGSVFRQTSYELGAAAAGQLSGRAL